MRAPLPTTDALFAQEVEQKMSNLLAGFGAVQSFLDRTKHRTAAQLEAAESTPGASKFESDLPSQPVRSLRCRFRARKKARHFRVCKGEAVGDAVRIRASERAAH